MCHLYYTQIYKILNKKLFLLIRKKEFFMNTEKNKEKWVEKIKQILEMGGRSEKTFLNYKSHLKRFLNYYDENTNLKKFDENDILNYIKINYIDKCLSGESYNMAIKSIKLFYSVCFNKELKKSLLPNHKLRKRLPNIIEKKTFIKIFNEEKNLKHKCWLLLAFCSGLRIEEIATLKIENIFPHEHKLKVLGKGNKERYTILPDITIKFLRHYCKKANIKRKNGYLFIGTANHDVMNSKTIINYFTMIKKKYSLDENLTFHCLRHSFATYYLSNGGDLLTLKSMLGHKSLNSTTIYLHLSHNFNQLEGIKYV